MQARPFPKGTTGVATLVAGRLLLLYISESYFAGTGLEPIGACLLCLKRSGSSFVLLSCLVNSCIFDWTDMKCWGSEAHRTIQPAIELRLPARWYLRSAPDIVITDVDHAICGSMGANSTRTTSRGKMYQGRRQIRPAPVASSCDDAVPWSPSACEIVQLGPYTLGDDRSHLLHPIL